MPVPYVDTDFLLALIKQDDWLQGSARKLLKKYKGELWTSSTTVVEIFLVAHKFGLNIENVTASLFKIVEVVNISEETALAAAHFVQERRLNVFDAFHAAFAMQDSIISSDKAFDSVGVKRIGLE